MKTRHIVPLALLLTDLAFGTPAASAQTIAFTQAPAALDTGEVGELRVELQLVSGTYTDLIVTMTFPDTNTHPETRLEGSTANPDFAYGTSLVNGVRTVTWTRLGTLDLSTSSSTRQFVYLFSLENTTLDGTPLAFTATVSGQMDGAPLSLAPATTTIIADRTIVHSPNLGGSGNLNGLNPLSGARGVLRSHEARLNYPGDNGMYPLVFETVMTLPAGVAWVESFATFGINGQLSAPMTPPTSATAWEILTVPTDVTMPYRDGATHLDEYPRTTARYFVPCGSIPFTPAPTVTADFDIAWVDFNSTEFSQTAILSNAVAGLATACGAGGSLGLTNTPSVSLSGTRISFPMRLIAPIGLPELEDALVTFTYPPGIIGTDHTGWNSATNPDDWETLSCNFSSLTLLDAGNRPTLADFLAYRDDWCTTSWQAGDTHGIFYADTLGGDRLGQMERSIRYLLPEDWSDVHGPRVDTPIWFTANDPEGEYDGWGDALVNPDDDRFELEVGVELPTTIVPTFGSGYPHGADFLDSNNPYTSPSTGPGWRRDLSWTGLSPRNARVTITIPPGATVTRAELTGLTGDCSPPPGAYTVSSWTQSPVILTMGTTDVPWTLPAICQGQIELQFRFGLDTSYPFFHEQPVQFTFTHTAENQTNTPDTTLTLSRTVIVAAGQDARLTAACDENGGTVFAARAINRGRDPIADGALTFALPIGTTATAIVLNSDVAATGGVLQVWETGGTSWSAPPANLVNVTHVRLVDLAIPGGTFTSLPPQPGFSVTLDAGTQTGPIEGVVTMSSPVLGATDPRAASIVPGTCPGSLGILVYYDLNGDGIRQNGEPTVLAGHVFELVPAATSATGAATDPTPTDANGLIAWDSVVPGTYDVVYVTSPPSNGTWVLGNPVTVVMASAGQSNAAVGLVCGCDAPDPANICVDAFCDVAGQCNTTFVEDLGPCDEANVVWVLVTQGGADFGIRCERFDDPEPRIVCADILTAPACAQ